MLRASYLPMKQLFLLSGIAAVLSFNGVLYADDKKTTQTEETAVDIATDLKGKAFTLRDGEYAPSQINDNIDHYVVYYTASW